MIPIPWTVILWMGAGMLFLLMIGWLLFSSEKQTRRLCFNALSGMGAALVWNVLVSSQDWTVQINMVTALAAGGLGIPGVALVAALQWML